MLHRFGDELWIADGPSIAIAGFAYPTRMIVIRLSNGELFLWSPIALSDPLREMIDPLGPVRHLVAPNTLHHMFIGDWRQAYPQASSYGLPSLSTKRPDLTWHHHLDDGAPTAWSEDIDQVVIRGNRIVTEVVFFHRRSGIVIFTDLIQHFEPKWFSGWRALIGKLDLLTGPRPTVPRKFRIAFGDRGLARSAVRRILAWPIEGVVAAHMPPISHNGGDAVRHAFKWLVPA